MASHSPAACCLESTFQEGTPVGRSFEIYGLNTYVVGEKSDKVIVILTDIYGNRYNNVLLTADQFAKAGYYVLIPDILQGDDVVAGVTELPDWLKKHPSEVTRPIVESFLKQLKNNINYKFLGLVGYCYGAKYAIQQLTESGYATAGAIAHPSFVTIEEVNQIKKPLLISAAEIDSIFSEELRHQTEDELKKIKAVYQLDLFSGVSHGYSIRGNKSDENVNYAAQKTFYDQVFWFNRFSK